MKYIIPAAIAIGTGLIVLLSYFFSSPVLLVLRLTLVDWAVILGGMAVLIGIFNLVIVHFRRIQARARGAFYSMVTVVFAVATFMLGIAEGFRAGEPALYGETSLSNMLFKSVILASQAALASLVMFFLVMAAVRMLRTKLNPWSVGFLAVLVIVLAGWQPLGFMGLVNRFREWLISVPATAGARGILLGVALGTVGIGLRVLTGSERPYKD